MRASFDTDSHPDSSHKSHIILHYNHLFKGLLILVALFCIIDGNLLGSH